MNELVSCGTHRTALPVRMLGKDASARNTAPPSVLRPNRRRSRALHLHLDLSQRTADDFTMFAAEGKAVGVI